MALHYNSHVLTYSGKIVKVSELKFNDLLMGPDSLPRRVMSIEINDDSECFIITPVFGHSFTVSGSQVLLLRKSVYLQRNATLKKLKYSLYPNPLPLQAAELNHVQGSSFRKCWFLGKTEVHYQEKSVPIDPYFLGLWLGDGSANVAGITSMDPEIIQEVYHQATRHGLKVTVNWKKNNSANTYMITKETLPDLA